MNLYDVSPDELGTFDYVFLGNVLVHLADPARALRALATVMRPGAELLSLEPNSLICRPEPSDPRSASSGTGTTRPRWWTPNRAGHRRLLHAAGLEVLEQGPSLFQPFGGRSRWPGRPSDARPRAAERGESVRAFSGCCAPALVCG